MADSRYVSLSYLLRGYNVQLLLNILHRFGKSGVPGVNFVTQTSIAHLPKDKFENCGAIPVPPTQS